MTLTGFDFRKEIFSAKTVGRRELAENKKNLKKVLTTSKKRDNIYLADAEKSQSETSGNA